MTLKAWNEGQEIEIWIRAKVKSEEPQTSPGVHDVVRALDYEERGHVERTEGMQVDEEEEDVAPLLALSDSSVDRIDCPGAVGDGEWLKVRNGITVDSGSAAFVMPTSWFPGCHYSLPLGARKGNSLWARQVRWLAMTDRTSCVSILPVDKNDKPHGNAQTSTRSSRVLPDLLMDLQLGWRTT